MIALENPFNIAVDHVFLLYRSRIQTASVTDEQKKELMALLEPCESKRPVKLSNIKELDKYEASIKALETKYEEYAGPEALAEICEQIDEIYNQCSFGMNIDNLKEKLAHVIKGGKACLIK